MQETMQTFRGLSAAGRVSTVIYFSWEDDPWAKQIGPALFFGAASSPKPDGPH